MSEIAATTITGVTAAGEYIAISVTIGTPYRETTDPEVWRCPVAVSPLYGRLADIAGNDSLQALCLATRLAFSLLHDFKGKGGRLLLAKEDGEETEFPVDAYLPQPPGGNA